MTARSKRTDEIRVRLETATTGPWDDNITSIDQHWSVGLHEVVGLTTHGTWDSYSTISWTPEDRALIANAPADLEYLLARVELLEGLLRETMPWAAWSQGSDLRKRCDAALGDE